MEVRKGTMRKVETPEGRSVRLLRVGEQVRHALSDILMRGDVHDDTLASHLVSVTEVRMSPDLRHATVFVKPLLGAGRGSGAEGAAHPHRLLPEGSRAARAHQICREAQFLADESFDEGGKIDTLLRSRQGRPGHSSKE